MHGTKNVVAGLIFFLFAVFHVKAQLYIGVEGGLSKNYLRTQDVLQTFTTYKPATGISVSIPLLFELNKWLAIKSSPNFSQKNYEIVRTGFFQGIYQKNINNYLQVPLQACVRFGEKKIKGFVNLGLYGAYWMSSRIKGVEPNILNTSDTTVSNPTGLLNIVNGYKYDQSYHFDRKKDNREEFGWIGGAGITYQLNHYIVILETEYSSAFSSQEKKYQLNQSPRFNTTFYTKVGCLLNIFSSSRPGKGKHII